MIVLIGACGEVELKLPSPDDELEDVLVDWEVCGEVER